MLGSFTQRFFYNAMLDSDYGSLIQTDTSPSGELLGRKRRLLLGLLSSEGVLEAGLTRAVTSFRCGSCGGAVGSFRLSLRAMVSAGWSSKGVGNLMVTGARESHTVASLKVPLPVGTSADLELSSQHSSAILGPPPKFQFFRIVPVDVRSGPSGLTA